MRTIQPSENPANSCTHREKGGIRVCWADFSLGLQDIPDSVTQGRRRSNGLPQREGALGRRWLPPHNRPAPAAPESGQEATFLAGKNVPPPNTVSTA